MLESFVSDAFEYRKLTEDEQKSRGILGRLVGVIADTQKPTRNGRKYSEKLWENVFENPIMKEKIANRCCFGELNHPADRSEVDLERVAICLAEYPKKDANGQLHGVFDILSTPNGRILKALCDYGCKIGISSRGQGDLITDDNGDEEVDPDTYDCECFDAVIVPGVEIARLKYVTESLHKDNSSLNKVLTEELETASPDARKIMEETLDMLQIKLTEATKEEEKEAEVVADIDTDTEQTETAEAEDNAATVDAEDASEADSSDEDIEDIDSGLAALLADDEPAEDSASDNSDEAEEAEEDTRTDEEIFLDFLASNFDEKQIKKVCDILDIEIEDDVDDEDKPEDDSEATDAEESSEEDKEE